ncbi:MAG: iron-containing alcohol dehydrogenase [Promethearchaeota archaeon]
MNFEPFNFARIPHIIFGAGKLSELYEIIPNYGYRAIIVTGSKSLEKSGKWDEISSKLKQKNIEFDHVRVSDEPSPALVDENAEKFRNKKVDLVIGIGGGSVIDAGKAISAMIPKTDSVKNYLEGVGHKQHDGVKIPYIAIPTTSGTGSEATKNAVISEVGPNGFKKSLRHDNLIPNVAIIDPELIISCPPSVTAACGMDAFTQLLEAFVSSKANPMTDALAFSGMKAMKDNMIPVCTNKGSEIEVRSAMAYGALISGITLANAGLGIVHGFASSIGGFFEIPHGVVCGTLLAEATKINLIKLKELGTKGREALLKHARIGGLFAGNECIQEKDIDYYCQVLTDTLRKWTESLQLDKLGKYGITEGDIDKIVEKTGLKNNPVPLTKEDLKTILLNRL